MKDIGDQDELEPVREKAQRIVVAVYASLGLGCSLVALTLKFAPSVLASGPPVSDHVAFSLAIVGAGNLVLIPAWSWLYGHRGNAL